MNKTFVDFFTYDFDNTPVVFNFTPTYLSVLGGELMTIEGENFPEEPSGVFIGNNRAEIVSLNSTQIVIVTPPQTQALGQYPLHIVCYQAIGYA